MAAFHYWGTCLVKIVDCNGESEFSNISFNFLSFNMGQHVNKHLVLNYENMRCSIKLLVTKERLSVRGELYSNHYKKLYMVWLEDRNAEYLEHAEKNITVTVMCKMNALDSTDMGSILRLKIYNLKPISKLEIGMLRCHEIPLENGL
ncbi:hypothetical protein DICVIV_10135 [Dictyocaulus viviparus]|uniref:Uncharacterized protein n=1 Tax=Dictyocaulus viviparus TaxID=29172 RepID=A0A0D8XJ65_DICVI|nr:hypothetical protein DICVIV_10135 [Dictyocaulus viviparus]